MGRGTVLDEILELSCFFLGALSEALLEELASLLFLHALVMLPFQVLELNRTDDSADLRR